MLTVLGFQLKHELTNLALRGSSKQPSRLGQKALPDELNLDFTGCLLQGMYENKGNIRHWKHAHSQKDLLAPLENVMQQTRAARNSCNA